MSSYYFKVGDGGRLLPSTRPPDHTVAGDGRPHSYAGTRCTVCNHYLFAGMTKDEIRDYGKSFGPWGA